MKPELKGNGDVVAHCPDCGALSTFETRTSGTEYGRIERQGVFKRLPAEIETYQLKVYHLLRCASCGRGGLAEVMMGQPGKRLDAFWPITMAIASLPAGTPADIRAEVREAERCASVTAWRAGSAMLRSATMRQALAARQRTVRAKPA